RADRRGVVPGKDPGVTRGAPPGSFRCGPGSGWDGHDGRVFGGLDCADRRDLPLERQDHRSWVCLAVIPVRGCWTGVASARWWIGCSTGRGPAAALRWERAGAGSGAVLVVRGEAGIGKTVVLDYAASRASVSGFRVVRGWGVESEME